jgi:hypothetical protein
MQDNYNRGAFTGHQKVSSRIAGADSRLNGATGNDDYNSLGVNIKVDSTL